MNMTVYLPDDLAQEVRDANLPVSNICQMALRRELHGAGDPLERIAANVTRICEALGIEVVDEPSTTQDEVEVGTEVLNGVAGRRQLLTYREFSDRLRDRGILLHWRSPRMAQLLIEISERSVARGRGLLSALVVGSATGLPGEGFFALAARQGRVGDHRTIWAHERDRLFEEARSNPEAGSTPTQ
jgi:hypothetical protein